MTSRPDPQLAAEIEALKQPPKVRLSRTVAALRTFGILLSVIAIVLATWATVQSHTALSCLSSILGDRAGVTQSDARAHIDWSRSLANLLEHPRDVAMYRKFVTVTDQYVATLAANQKYRDAHPLQRCGANSTTILPGVK